MRFVYARVSSKDQHLDRQIEEIKKIFPDIEEQNIYSDKQSGKDFNRTNYQKLKEIVSSGDEIIIKELDRLGRNKDEIKKELAWFKEKKVICRILDVPTTLIDFKDQDWLFDMINNVMIEVMGAIAEQERKKIKQRQKEGIAVAKANGVRFGRPKLEVPEFDEVYKKVQSSSITLKEALEKLNISKRSWYRLCKEVV